VKKVNFCSVFEAVKGADLFGWERHHHYGSLEFTVTEGQISLLREKNIKFWLAD
jgi:hypothetical protein